MKTLAENMSEDTISRIANTTEELLPRVLPAEWRCTSNYVNCRWYSSSDGLRVCVEVEEHGNELWAHLSMSRRDRDPSYFDMRRVKGLFIGDNRKAIQVLPRADEHYSLHPHCLHLWAPLDRDPLPDFRSAAGEI